LLPPTESHFSTGYGPICLRGGSAVVPADIPAVVGDDALGEQGSSGCGVTTLACFTH